MSKKIIIDSNSNIFLLKKEKAIQNILLCLFVFFLSVFIFFKVYFFGFISITCLIGLVCFYLQRDIKIEVTDDGFTLIKYNSKILPDVMQEIKYKDIENIRIISTQWKSFHVIKLKNAKKSINIPNEINKDFDNYIKNICNENPNYKDDSKLNIGQILLIISAFASFPVLVLLIFFNNTLLTVSVISIFSFVLFLSIYLYTR